MGWSAAVSVRRARPGSSTRVGRRLLPVRPDVGAVDDVHPATTPAAEAATLSQDATGPLLVVADGYGQWLEARPLEEQLARAISPMNGRGRYSDATAEGCRVLRDATAYFGQSHVRHDASSASNGVTYADGCDVRGEKFGFGTVEDEVHSSDDLVVGYFPADEE